MQKGVLSLLVCGLILAFLPSWVSAEDGNETIQWKLSGEARFRPEYRNDADLNSDEDDVLRSGFMRIRLGVLVTVKEDYQVFVQVQDSRVGGEEFSTASDEQNVDLHQGFVKVAGLGVAGLSFTIGRQEWNYGDQRMIGAFGWNNVGRSFDGVKVRYAPQDNYYLDAILAETSNNVEAGAPQGSDLYGVYLHTTPRPAGEYEAYYLGFSDRKNGDGEITGEMGDTQIHALGGRVKDRFGSFDGLLEAVVERGEIDGDDLSAMAASVEAGWNWGSEVKGRVFAGYDFATGDEDPNDGDREEFFNFFPTNHKFYGYADYEGWRNLRSYYGGYSLKKGRHFGQVKLHHFALEEERGRWSNAGGMTLGFDPTGMSGRSVGSEVDLNYKFAWREKASIAAGVSRFEPGRFARLNRGEDNSHWGYVMLTFGF